MAKKTNKKSSRGRKQDRARAGGQDHEVRYEARKNGRVEAATARKKLGKRLIRLLLRIKISSGAVDHPYGRSFNARQALREFSCGILGSFYATLLRGCVARSALTGRQGQPVH